MKTLKTYPVIFPLLYGLIIGAALTAFATTVLFCASYIQLKNADPLGQNSIASLTARIKNNPADKTILEHVRTLDLLSRTTYFTSRRQMDIAAGVCAASVVLLLLSLKMLALIAQKKRQKMAPLTGEHNFLKITQQWFALAVFGVLMIAIAMVTRFLINKEFDTAAKTSQAKLIEESTRQWPQFRGPYASGNCTNRKIPTSWDGAKKINLRWKSAVPKPGLSSPIIWNNRIFCTGADRKSREVYCFDLASGSLVWKRNIGTIAGSPDSTTLPENGSTGFAASTPATDGQRVYAIFGTGDLVCFSMGGRRIWARNLGVPQNQYGHASSLIVTTTTLFVQYDQSENARLIAINSRSGATLWEQKREGLSWATPLLWRRGSQVELVCANSSTLSAYNPADGKKNWEIACLSGDMAPSPAIGDSIVFDGVEYGSAAAVAISDSARVAWTLSENIPAISSPVIAKGYLFVATSAGVISCISAETGLQLWQKDFSYGFSASILAIGDTLIAVDTDGTSHLFFADSTYREIAANPLGEPVQATPAIVENAIVIRSETNLFCIGTR